MEIYKKVLKFWSKRFAKQMIILSCQPLEESFWKQPT